MIDFRGDNMAICTDIKELEKIKAEGIKFNVTFNEDLPKFRESETYLFNPVLNKFLQKFIKKAEEKTVYVLDISPRIFPEFIKLFNNNRVAALSEYADCIIYVNPKLISQYTNRQ